MVMVRWDNSHSFLIFIERNVLKKRRKALEGGKEQCNIGCTVILCAIIVRAGISLRLAKDIFLWHIPYTI